MTHGAPEPFWDRLGALLRIERQVGLVQVDLGTRVPVPGPLGIS